MIYNDINFSWSVNWGEGFDLKYRFMTGIISSSSEREQRTALRDLPQRSMSFNLWEKKAVAVKIINELRTAYQNDVYVPIYSERFKSTDTGATVINGVIYTIATENTQYLYNLHGGTNNCLLVSDVRGLQASARTTYSGLSNTGLTFAISGTFSCPIESIRLYPMVKCFLRSLDIEAETDDLLNFSMTFEER